MFTVVAILIQFRCIFVLYELTSEMNSSTNIDITVKYYRDEKLHGLHFDLNYLYEIRVGRWSYVPLFTQMFIGTIERNSVTPALLLR